MPRLNKFEKIVSKMGKMNVKREDSRLYQCSKKEKLLINPKDCHKYLQKSIKMISTEILVFRTE